MSRRLRVLIADDNLGVVRSLSRLLTLDHEVVGVVASGSELLDATQLLQPDVIVLDLSLRDIGSLKACRQITQGGCASKVIIFTAADDPDVRRRAFEAGATAFIQKFSPDALLAAIGEHGRSRDATA